LAANARFIVSVAEDCEPFDLDAMHPWSRSRVEWSWVDRENFRKYWYHAPTLDRYKRDTDADVVLFLDADTMLIRGVDDILEAIVAQPAIAGLISHPPPFHADQTGIGWESLLAAMGLPLPAARFQHSGWGAMLTQEAHRFAPAYYNYGAVFFPAVVFSRLRPHIQSCLERTTGLPIHPGFRSQLALTLAIYELNLPHVALDVRYNYPNDDWADRFHPTELADVRIIHYLREEILGARRDVWGSEEAFQQFLSRHDLSGSNEVLRGSVAALRDLKSSLETVAPIVE